MARLSTMIRRIFNQAWDRYERPEMAVVPPLDEWSLPAGFEYDPTTDTVHNSEDVWLDNWPSYLEVEYLRIVPASPSADLQIMRAAGEVSSGLSEVMILGDDVPTVREAFAVQIQGEWYNILNVQENPIGSVTPIWSRVLIERRV